MKKPLLTILLVTLHICTAFSQDTTNNCIAFSQDTTNNKLISDFITCFKQKDRKALSEKVAYPYYVEYPLPLIKNRQEFLNRFNEVFDDSLIKVIVASKA